MIFMLTKAKAVIDDTEGVLEAPTLYKVYRGISRDPLTRDLAICYRRHEDFDRFFGVRK